MAVKPQLPKRLTIADSTEEILEGMRHNKVAAALLNSMWDLPSMGVEIILFTYVPWTHTTFGDYIAIRSDGMSYLPANAPRSHPWTRGHRQVGRWGRVARSLIRTDRLQYLTDKDFEEFSNLLSAYWLQETRPIQIVRGEEIMDWYDEDKYASSQETLSSSCMRYSECRPYFALYAENPDKISMAIMTDKYDLLIGRALIWKTDKHGEAMDRVYGRQGTVKAFHAFAKERGMLRRNRNSFEYPNEWRTPDDKLRRLSMSVTLENIKQSRYPYLDTFKYIFVEDNKLKNHQRGKRSDYILDDTDGEPYGGYCQRCGVYALERTAYLMMDEGGHQLLEYLHLCSGCSSYTRQCSVCYRAYTPEVFVDAEEVGLKYWQIGSRQYQTICAGCVRNRTSYDLPEPVEARIRLTVDTMNAYT